MVYFFTNKIEGALIIWFCFFFLNKSIEIAENRLKSRQQQRGVRLRNVLLKVPKTAEISKVLCPVSGMAGGGGASAGSPLP